MRDQLTDVDHQRQTVEARLLELRQADEELARLQEETTGFDLTLYQRAAELVAAEALIPDLAAAVLRRARRPRTVSGTQTAVTARSWRHRPNSVLVREAAEQSADR